MSADLLLAPVGSFVSNTPVLTKSLPRLHVEEAEDKLVQCTETAIGLMKAVLENVSVPHSAPNIHDADLPRLIQPEPLQNLSSLVKAQLIYFSTAAETLSVSLLTVYLILFASTPNR